MKKFILVFVLLLVFALPVMADEGAIQVYVNGNLLSTPGVFLGDKTYLPVRAVSEALGQDVTWDGTVHIDTPVKLKRPDITGEPGFIEKANRALDLLEQKDYPDYALVCELGWPIIRKDKSPLAEMWGHNPNNVLAGIEVATNDFHPAIVIYDTLINDKKCFDPQFLAGIITHEACHGISNKHFNTIEIMNTNLGETVAYEHELTALKLIGAPQWMKDYTERSSERSLTEDF